VKDNLAGAAWRFAVFAVVCVLGAFGVMAIFSKFRLQPETIYRAEFANVTGLQPGNLVRIAGAEVGEVKSISITKKAIAVVEFSTDDSVVLTRGSKAAIHWADPIGGRYLALEQGAGDIGRLNAGQTIPVDHTQPALDLDTLLGGFRPLFRALDPNQVNALSAQLIEVFQGEGATISSFLGQAAAFTNTLADRDALIGQVISNLNSVLGSLSEQSGQFGKAVDSLSQLVQNLAARRGDITNAVAYANAATGTVADLFRQARPAFQNTVHQADRTAGIVVADHAYVDDLLNTLPDSYKALSRLGLYGDYFTFYLCDLLLKVNGKGGQPVYIKLVEQTTGRCTPK
jgi:phospholipid/cholesterol/gamma-HCH transport system substrate-binding protein